MLSAVLDKLRRLVDSSGSNPDDDGDAGDDGPDLYECEGCGSVFISKPKQCSSCEDDDFSNVGKFQR
jgi:rubrerythrin